MTKTGRLGLLIFIYGFFMLTLHTIKESPMLFGEFGMYWYGLNILVGGILFYREEPEKTE